MKKTELPAPTPDLAAAAAAADAALGCGIGTLNERTLHATLKYWLQPDVALHEVAVGGCIADIFDGAHATEVQTGGCFPLQKKLRKLLSLNPVTVVIPLPHAKWVRWVDPQSGEVGDPHRAPRLGRLSEALPQLYWLERFWQEGGAPHPLTVRVLLLDIVEYRRQDGWGNAGKRGAHRLDRRPLKLCEDVTLTGFADAAALLPDLPAEFTTPEFVKLFGHRGVAMRYALRFLERGGLIFRAGTRGRAILYRRK